MKPSFGSESGRSVSFSKKTFLSKGVQQDKQEKDFRVSFFPLDPNETRKGVTGFLGKTTYDGTHMTRHDPRGRRRDH